MEILSPAAHKLVNSESTETVVNNAATYIGNSAPAPPAKAVANHSHPPSEPAAEKQSAHVHKAGRPPRHSTNGGDAASHNGTVAAPSQHGAAKNIRHHQPARSRDEIGRAHV